MSKIATPQFEKILKETSDFNTCYSEACSKSGAIFMKGMEDIMSEVMSLAQGASEKQAELVKEIMSIKNVSELSEIQNKLMKSGFDDFVSGATKISEISAKVLTDSAQPVNEQIKQAAKKATKSMAA